MSTAHSVMLAVTSAWDMSRQPDGTGGLLATSGLIMQQTPDCDSSHRTSTPDGAAGANAGSDAHSASLRQIPGWPCTPSHAAGAGLAAHTPTRTAHIPRTRSPLIRTRVLKMDEGGAPPRTAGGEEALENGPSQDARAGDAHVAAVLAEEGEGEGEDEDGGSDGARALLPPVPAPEGAVSASTLTANSRAKAAAASPAAAARMGHLPSRDAGRKDVVLLFGDSHTVGFCGNCKWFGKKRPFPKPVLTTVGRS